MTQGATEKNILLKDQYNIKRDKKDNTRDQAFRHLPSLKNKNQNGFSVFFKATGILFFALWYALPGKGGAGLAETPAQKTITIKAVGDMVPGTNFPSASRLPVGGASALLKDVQPLLEGADILAGNYESTLTDYPKTRKDTSRKMVFAFRAPPSYAIDFQKAGFDLLNIANNHSYDFFATGFNDTAQAILNAGMTVTGKKGEINYIEKNGLRIAFIGYSYLSYHNSVHRLQESAALVAKAQESADIVIVTVHMGAEGNSAIHTANKSEMFYSENRGNPVLFAHTMIDRGADLVLGHGPHVPRAMELYKGRLIAYSLGNFMGYKVFSIRQHTGTSLVLEVRLGADGTFLSGKILPVALSATGVPGPDTSGKSVSLIRTLCAEDFPGDELRISPEGQLSAGQ